MNEYGKGPVHHAFDALETLDLMRERAMKFGDIPPGVTVYRAAAREIEKPISEEEAKHNELEGAKS